MTISVKFFLNLCHKVQESTFWDRGQRVRSACFGLYQGVFAGGSPDTTQSRKSPKGSGGEESRLWGQLALLLAGGPGARCLTPPRCHSFLCKMGVTAAAPRRAAAEGWLRARMTCFTCGGYCPSPHTANVQGCGCLWQNLPDTHRFLNHFFFSQKYLESLKFEMSHV